MERINPMADEMGGTRQKLVVRTLGCKVNQCESDAILQGLTQPGGLFVPGKDGSADLVIINTCTVTQKAGMQSRQMVRQAVRANPGAQIVVTGCHAQMSPDELYAIDGVDQVIGNPDKLCIPEMARFGGCGCETADDARFRGISGAGHQGRTRPFLKIQDGCDAFCTYCIVPHARGRSRSMPVRQVLDALHGLAQQGVQEVVLTGIHIGCYGRDLSPATGLWALLCRVRDEIAIPRIRLSSIEPMELSDDIIALAAGDTRQTGKLCPHFHVPLQSGDNDILARMHRPYTREFFRDRIISVMDRVADAAIGVDVLVGFPGESDAAFEQTHDLIASLPVAYLHVFPFSARKGTPAFSFKNPVPARVIKARCDQMRKLGHEKRWSFYSRYPGKTLRVLIETSRDKKTGLLKGLTDNYGRVWVDGPDALFNTLQNMDIEKISSDSTLTGRLSAD